jgi:hypothetical protein
VWPNWLFLRSLAEAFIVRRLIFAALALAVLATPGNALECPELKAVSIAGMSDAERDRIAVDLRDYMKGQGDLAAIVSGVQRRMPGTNSAELTNYLISDYCALVKDRTDLSDSAKSSAVETFAAEVTRVLY